MCIDPSEEDFFLNDRAQCSYLFSNCHPWPAHLPFPSNAWEVWFPHLCLTSLYTELTSLLRIQLLNPVCCKFSSAPNTCSFFWLPQLWVTAASKLYADLKTINSTKPWWVFNNETSSSHLKYEGTMGIILLPITLLPIILWSFMPRQNIKATILSQLPS